MYSCVYLSGYEFSHSEAILLTAAVLLCECYQKIDWRDICTCEYLLQYIMSAVESLAPYTPSPPL